jgi:hypothetical protein
MDHYCKEQQWKHATWYKNLRTVAHVRRPVGRPNAESGKILEHERGDTRDGSPIIFSGSKLKAMSDHWKSALLSQTDMYDTKTIPPIRQARTAENKYDAMKQQIDLLKKRLAEDELHIPGPPLKVADTVVDSSLVMQCQKTVSSQKANFERRKAAFTQALATALGSKEASLLAASEISKALNNKDSSALTSSSQLWQVIQSHKTFRSVEQHCA